MSLSHHVHLVSRDPLHMLCLVTDHVIVETLEFHVTEHVIDPVTGSGDFPGHVILSRV